MCRSVVEGWAGMGRRRTAHGFGGPQGSALELGGAMGETIVETRDWALDRSWERGEESGGRVCPANGGGCAGFATEVVVVVVVVVGEVRGSQDSPAAR